MDSHPKRFDLWSIYLDMEATQGDIASLRYVNAMLSAGLLLISVAEIFSTDCSH